MLCLFFSGFCLFDSILGPSRLGLGNDIIGFFIGVVAFMLLGWLGDEVTIATNAREIYENGLLFDKMKTEVEKAIAANKNVIHIIVNKAYHPIAGVYYNVHTE